MATLVVLAVSLFCFVFYIDFDSIHQVSSFFRATLFLKFRLFLEFFKKFSLHQHCSEEFDFIVEFASFSQNFKLKLKMKTFVVVVVVALIVFRTLISKSF